MPHIPFEPGVPGIRGPMVFRPETAKPLRQLAEILLRGPSTLTPGERELIATYVSALNDCHYCQTIHGYTAAAYLDGDDALVNLAKRDPEKAAISEKLKALLAIAAKVQQSGKLAGSEDIDRARKLGATDLEIHDTVLIAAAFCMYNRYVDGLATWAPEQDHIYRNMANRVVTVGYTQPGWEKPFSEEKSGKEETL
jgi:uncharacterized peroxidase-related enzyme